MTPLPHAIPASLSLRVGQRVFPVQGVELSGQHAALRVEPAPSRCLPVRLLLDWDQGGHTEIAGAVSSTPAADHLTHLDLYAVRGDWQPLLAWLGTKTSA